VTTGVGDAAGDALGVGVTLTVAVAFGVGVAFGLGVAAVVAVALAVAVAVAVAFAVAVAVEFGVARAELPVLAVGCTEPLAVGANVVAAAAGVDGDEQADTAAEPRTAMAPKPTAVSNAWGVRTLLRYPPGQP
jgi:hypothetical protein